MAEQENTTTSYRKIFKATSLFGGVQVYQILIGIIRSKFVAVLLGPAGMGMQGLYQSAIQLVQSLSSLGLSQSAVRDVSEANGLQDAKQVGLTVAVVKRLVWLTGLLGLCATVVLSPILSKTAFGNYDYTLPFIVLSVTLLLDQLSAGQRVVLQGMRKLKYLAKSTAIGSTIGLLISVPLYYLIGIKGIVPTIILNSVTMLCLTWYFSKKVKIEKVEVTNKQTLQKGKSMLQMGLAMSISGMLSLLCAYLLRGFIRYFSDIEQVGLYTAGFTIINTYVGMIFNAMITDYYPRVAAVNHDNSKCRNMVNQQSEIGILIMAPMLLVCLVYMPIIIKILYSNKFLGAIDYVLWTIPGLFFKLCSWAIAILFVAKSAHKLYIVNEIIGNIATVIFSIIGFYFYGLSGMGIGFTIGYVIYFLRVFFLAKSEYNFFYTKPFMLLCLIQFVLVIIGLICVLFLDKISLYISGTLLIVISLAISLKELNKRLVIFQKNKLWKKNH